MSFFTIAAEDRSHRHPDADQRAADALLVELMTPLVKGWCTEVSMESTSLGVQVHGGMGFIEETGAAQHMRDARILPIYEGTNGIQALDFVGRKCLRDGGETIALLLADMQQTVSETSSATGAVKDLASALATTIEQCQQALDYVLANSAKSPSLAYNFLMLFGNSVSFWLLVKLAAAAQKHIDEGSNDPFYGQKIKTASFFSSQILTRNLAYLASVITDSNYAEELVAADFQTL
jgi:hypothetical protein